MGLRGLGSAVSHDPHLQCIAEDTASATTTDSHWGRPFETASCSQAPLFKASVTAVATISAIGNRRVHQSSKCRVLLWPIPKGYQLGGGDTGKGEELLGWKWQETNKKGLRQKRHGGQADGQLVTSTALVRVMRWLLRYHHGIFKRRAKNHRSCIANDLHSKREKGDGE